MPSPPPPAPPIPPGPPSPPIPPPLPCATQANDLSGNRLLLISQWEGELGNVNAIISAAESKANSYTLGSPCQRAFQEFANRLKAQRDYLIGIYTSAMATNMTIDCNDPNWQDIVHTVDLLMGQISNIVDLMNKLYRDARKKIPSYGCTGFECPDFDDYEPDVNLCSRVTSEAEMTILNATTDWDAMILAAETKKNAATDPETRDTWQNTKMILQEMKNCFQVNIPPDVSCSHKYWEQRKNQRLGAANLMKAMAECLHAQIFGP